MRSLVVIDDEFIVVEGLKAIIAREQLEYEIVGWAYDGIAALQVINEKKPDVVITDIRIPGLDGLSLIEEAKESLPDTVFIVISGYTEFEYARKALSLGVKGYIDKPITVEKLTAVLDKIEDEFKKAEKENATETMGETLRQVLQIHLEALIQGIMQEDEEKIKKYSNSFLAENKKLKREFGEYKNECFNFLCVVVGVFLEQNRDYEREYLVSYSDMEEKESFQEVDLYVEGIITRIGETIKNKKTGSNHRIIIQLLEYISEHYNEDVGLNELADMVKMNPAYLSILFKEEVGMSYIKYLTKTRMEQAKLFLSKGYKVIEVSEMVGYRDYHYFCSVFKKNTGKKPNEYKGCIRKR